ncbi:hypothetical protein D1007_32065 [Hordeum vulgare]|nr:hypothetical protein D1007_32065 [Hordeum vulgare]
MDLLRVPGRSRRTGSMAIGYHPGSWPGICASWRARVSLLRGAGGCLAPTSLRIQPGRSHHQRPKQARMHVCSCCAGYHCAATRLGIARVCSPPPSPALSRSHHAALRRSKSQPDSPRPRRLTAASSRRRAAEPAAPLLRVPFEAPCLEPPSLLHPPRRGLAAPCIHRRLSE